MVCKNLEFNVCGSLPFSNLVTILVSKDDVHRMNFPGNAVWLDTEWYYLCSDRFSSFMPLF